VANKVKVPASQRQGQHLTLQEIQVLIPSSLSTNITWLICSLVQQNIHTDVFDIYFRTEN
jgi:hypothetical protein